MRCGCLPPHTEHSLWFKAHHFSFEPQFFHLGTKVVNYLLNVPLRLNSLCLQKAWRSWMEREALRGCVHIACSFRLQIFTLYSTSASQNCFRAFPYKMSLCWFVLNWKLTYLFAFQTILLHFCITLSVQNAPALVNICQMELRLSKPLGQV